MNLCMRFTYGRSFSLEVDEDDTVEAIKKKIQTKEGCCLSLLSNDCQNLSSFCSSFSLIVFFHHSCLLKAFPHSLSYNLSFMTIFLFLRNFTRICRSI